MEDEGFEEEDKLPEGDCSRLPWVVGGGRPHGFGCSQSPLYDVVKLCVKECFGVRG